MGFEMKYLLGTVLLCALVGCSASREPSGYDLDNGTGSTGSGAAGAGGGAQGGDLGLGGSGPQSACNVAAQQQADATCKLEVSIDTFMLSGSACWVDSPLKEGQPGELEFACGDGAAKLSFPSGVFTGTNKSCNLDLGLTTQFDFVDGCTWESDQKIVGHMEGQLTYSYSEKPIVGTQCASPCTVDAQLSLGQTGPVTVEPPK